MTLSLAKDKLNYNPAQLDDLSHKLRFGDLTPILQIYEEEIKSPVRSTVSGTLLRSAFIQVQKAKVRPFARVSQSLLITSPRLMSARHSQGSISFSSHKNSHLPLLVWRLHCHSCMLWVVSWADSSQPAVATWEAGGGGVQQHG